MKDNTRPVVVEQHQPKTQKHHEKAFFEAFFENDKAYKALRSQVHETWTEACKATGISPDELFVFPADLEKPTYWERYDLALQEYTTYTQEKLSALALNPERVQHLVGVIRDKSGPQEAVVQPSLVTLCSNLGFKQTEKS